MKSTKKKPTKHSIKLTGLWETNTNQDGQVSLSGNILGLFSLVIHPNDHKTKDSQPDYYAYLYKMED